MKHIHLSLLAAALFLAACSSEGSLASPEESGSSSSGSAVDVDVASDALNFTIDFDEADRATYAANAEVVPTDATASDYEDFAENFTSTNTVTIRYSQSEDATYAMTTDDADIQVSISGNDVVVSSSAKGVTYVLTGESSNGSFKMADGTNDHKFGLVLAGVTLSKAGGAAINIQPSKRCYLQIEAGTENKVSTTGKYSGSDEDQKAAIFSEGKLLIGGTGKLSISTTKMHGICSDSYVWIHSGDIDITTQAKDGIHANDSVVIGGGELDITSFGDGIQVEQAGGTYVQHGGFVAIKASSSGSDRSHGVKAEGTAKSVSIDGGALQIAVSDSGAKAVKADGAVDVAGGRLTLITSGDAVIDDGDTDYTASAGIKADGTITLSDGEVLARSSGSGGKGISGDGIIRLSGATVKVITTGSHVGYSGGGMGGRASWGTASASPKGIKADGNLYIEGGTVLVRATGGENAEGIESKASVNISGGATGIYAYDDGLNASSAIVQTGGYLYACGTNNDGIDSNGTITVSGGVMIGSGTSSPEEGIDIDNGSIGGSGGVVIGMGGNMNGTPPVTGDQPYVVTSGTTWSKGATCCLTTNGGNIYFTTDRAMSGGSIMISSPQLTNGSSYTLSIGGTLTGSTSSFFGYATDGTFSGGSSYSLTAGTSSSSGGGPGFGGGGRRW